MPNLLPAALASMLAAVAPAWADEAKQSRPYHFPCDECSVEHGDPLPPSAPHTWHLLTITYGGTVSLIKDLTQRECEEIRTRIMSLRADSRESVQERLPDRIGQHQISGVLSMSDTLNRNDLDALEAALKKATPGRWAMFSDEGVYTLMPAMRDGEVATGLTEEDAMLVHLFKWNASALIAMAKRGLERQPADVNELRMMLNDSGDREFELRKERNVLCAEIRKVKP